MGLSTGWSSSQAHHEQGSYGFSHGFLRVLLITVRKNTQEASRVSGGYFGILESQDKWMSLSASQPYCPSWARDGLREAKHVSSEPGLLLGAVYRSYNLILVPGLLGKGSAPGLTQTMSGQGHVLWTEYPSQSPSFSLEQRLLKPKCRELWTGTHGSREQYLYVCSPRILPTTTCRAEPT